MALGICDRRRMTGATAGANRLAAGGGPQLLSLPRAASYAAPADADRALMVAQRSSDDHGCSESISVQQRASVGVAATARRRFKRTFSGRARRLYGVFVAVNASLSGPIERRRFQHRPEFGPSRRSGPTGPFAWQASCLGGRATVTLCRCSPARALFRIVEARGNWSLAH